MISLVNIAALLAGYFVAATRANSTVFGQSLLLRDAIFQAGSNLTVEKPREIVSLDTVSHDDESQATWTRDDYKQSLFIVRPIPASEFPSSSEEAFQQQQHRKDNEIRRLLDCSTSESCSSRSRILSNPNRHYISSRWE